jgi:hypothetical protein
MKVQFSTIRFLTSLCTGFLLFLAPAYAQPQPEDGNEGSLIDFSIKEAFLNFSYLGNKPAPSMGGQNERPELIAAIDFIQKEYGNPILIGNRSGPESTRLSPQKGATFRLWSSTGCRCKACQRNQNRATGHIWHSLSATSYSSPAIRTNSARSINWQTCRRQ